MTPTNILVPIDFSPTSEHALDYAISLAGKLEARVHALHVIGIPTLGFPELGLAWTSVSIDSLVRDKQAALDRLVDPRRALGTFGEVIVRVGDPRDAIVQGAKELKADLIVMGTHGRRGVARVLLGSVAEEIVRTAPCPILCVRAKH